MATTDKKSIASSSPLPKKTLPAMADAGDSENTETTYLSSATEEAGGVPHNNNASGRAAVPKEEPHLDWSFLANGQIYGRETELAELREAFRRHLAAGKEPSPELILVSGQSGTGELQIASY